MVDEGRSGFRDWIDKQIDPEWKLLPLTHIAKAFVAEDIVRQDSVRTSDCPRLNKPLAYFYYGRPAYRSNKDDVVKIEAACPVCFVLDGEIVEKADTVFAFDSGAYLARMYKHVLLDEMNLEDFSLGKDTSRLNKLVKAAFSSQRAYFDGDRSSLVSPADGAKPWEYLARSYLDLLVSPGRNEPDDRVCSIEVLFSESVALKDALIAIVVPHTHWRAEGRSPWLAELETNKVAVLPYNFIPGRHPEYYQSQIEEVIRGFYQDRDFL